MDLSIDYDKSSPNYLDLVFEGGDLRLTSDGDAQGTNAVLQNIQQALRSYQGEWFLNLPEGVPYFQEIFKKGTSAAERESILRSAVIEAPGVIRVTEFLATTDAASRSMQVTFAAQTTQGALTASVSIEFPGGSRP